MGNDIKKKFEEVAEETDYPAGAGKKKYKSYKKGFTRKYAKYRK